MSGNSPRHALVEPPPGWQRLPALLGRLIALLYAFLARRWSRSLARLRSDSGMSTAEYAIGTIAAAAFAALLYTVVTGDSVLSGLTQLVQRALSADL